MPNLHFSLMCSISSSEVLTPFEGGARATELESPGALKRLRYYAIQFVTSAHLKLDGDVAILV